MPDETIHSAHWGQGGKMNSSNCLKVVIVHRGEIHEAISYAALELKKYLELMSAEQTKVEIEKAVDFNKPINNGITIGLFNSLGLTPKGLAGDFDDEIYIDIVEGKGIICGINPRSVLLAIYRFLTEAGCRWVRPGIDGESIPKKDISLFSIKLSERPAYRHRGVCIEGANSNENILDMIEWLPKMGLNAYFIQFREAYTFYNSWYAHRNNPLKTPELFSVEQAREYVAQAIKEIKKRDLVYHAVGHGWTCEPIGIPGLSWDSKEYELTPDVEQYLAEVDGKRQVWKGIALNTNLCYSNPEVRNLITNDIVQYIEKHEEIDILHFWLGDGANNQCECENCCKALPSDFYVQMLNDLDKMLTDKNIRTKIVFLIYVDLLWEPETERIINPDRFILMFAPITRTYSSAFNTDNPLPEPEPYKRNKLKFPDSVEENLAALGMWQKVFSGDSFDFDYHLMWDQCIEPGSYKTAEILHADICNLHKTGLNGYMSCQVQRVFFPSGLGMYTMGRSLWDTDLNFDAIARDYFTSAFGSEGLLCMDYLAGISELFDAPYLRGEKPRVSSEQADRFCSIPGFVEGFRDTIEKNINVNLNNECISKSWQYLRLHGDMCVIYGQMLEAAARGDDTGAEGLKNKLFELMQKNEDSIQAVFDLYLFTITINGRLFKRIFS